MIFQFPRAILIASTLLFVPLAARADGLFSIPVAQNPDKGTTELILEQDASGASFRSPDTLRIGTVEYGLTRQLAVGFDARLIGRGRVEPNFSLLLSRPKAAVNVALGYQNVGVRSFGEQPYVVASGNLGTFSLHGGLTRDSGGTHPMIGLEKHFGSKFELEADAINGAGNYITLGGQFALAKNANLAAGYMIANSRGDSNGLYLSIERDLK